MRGGVIDYLPFKVIKRMKLGIGLDDFVVMSSKRLDANKNNGTLIRTVSKTEEMIKLLICDDDDQRKDLKRLAKDLDVENRVIFLGTRNDMKEIYQVADALAVSSFREGLSRTIMEEMASGLHCIISRIRGNIDLVEHNVNGYLCNPRNINSFIASFKKVASNPNLYNQMHVRNIFKITGYDIYIVQQKMRDIYTTELGVRL